MRAAFACRDPAEAQKLASLSYVKDDGRTYVTGILNVIGSEAVVSARDGSAHSIVFGSEADAEGFADFVQSVSEGRHRITGASASGSTASLEKS